MSQAKSLAVPGALVRARGREWVVLPGSAEDLLLLKPIGGLDEETSGLIPSLERVDSASFSLPGQRDLGDFASCKLLRDATRLSTRSASGPFRSFGRIDVEPRPYQLVPLMMALKLDPIRLLIADDVGIGKTIEAALIVRELLDRGEIRRFTVLCPPHLAEQWQAELSTKFHIDADLVLSSTIDRLERNLPHGVSVFERHPYTIVSTDFIKSSRRVEDFIRSCPEFVIVDEAHGCTIADGVGRGRQQRFAMLQKLAAHPTRHLLLVTATPHSGKEEAFRSLLSLLHPELQSLPEDLDGLFRDAIRNRLSQHLVQRRRADIRAYLDQDTAFPDRKDKESSYKLSPAYHALLSDILHFAQEYVQSDSGHRVQRVRTWSALALLRCASSSPAAAAATLRSRAAVDEAADDDVEAVGARTVLDLDDTDEALFLDFSPGSDTASASPSTRKQLLELARRAESLSAKDDHKLTQAIQEIKALIKDGFRPVVFCRFVHTAEYVATNLRESLQKSVNIECVTGSIPSAEREARILSLTSVDGPCVLVCTDCLSEGINLQEQFDAVFHYDLAWNPTRHEQREGRVDRFGQRRPEVRVVTYYGSDNPIDGVILNVLIRKHKQIKSDLGVTVAVPGSSEQVAEALFSSALMQRRADKEEQLLFQFIDSIDAKKTSLHGEWDNAREHERRSRSRFAQESLKPEAVAAELKEVQTAIGGRKDAWNFLLAALKAAAVPIAKRSGAYELGFGKKTPRSLRQVLDHETPILVSSDLPVPRGVLPVARTSPLIEGLATWVLDHALDGEAHASNSTASRMGVIATAAVNARTVLFVVRFRYQLSTRGSADSPLLAEEVVTLAATGDPASPAWLSAGNAEALLEAQPSRNLVRATIDQQTVWLLQALPIYQESLSSVALEHAAAQAEAHERVRRASKRTGKIQVEPILPADIVGAYILIPEAT